MKKSKLITGLSAAFVSAMALMSCSTLVKAKSGVILTIDGVQYTAEDLFNDQKTPAAAEAKFNAVYKVAVRAYFTKDPGKQDMAEITRQVKVKMSEQKANAKSNADKNGTSYDVEWKKILKENGVDSTKKLQDKFEYDLQKEKFEDRFYEDNYDRLRHDNNPEKGPLFPKDTGFEDYFTSKQPYHMKHILVKVDGIGNDNTTGTITAEQSQKLYDVITQLAKGVPFDEVSKLSDDEGSRKEYGSLGIMSRDTSFVDDFKLGTYLYESFYGDSTVNVDSHQDVLAEKAINKLKLNKSTATDGSIAGDYANAIHDEVLDETSGEAIGVIPYEAAEKLGKKRDGGYADYEWEDQPLLKQAGIEKSDFKDKYLPRNVIFNKYFNKHNIMVIAPAKMPSSTFTYGTEIKEEGKGSYRAHEEGFVCQNDDTTYPVTTYKGFANNIDAKNGDKLIVNSGTNLATAVGTNGRVLRDNNGRIILVFRSGTGGSSNDDSGYQGIHFVVIERSPFIGKENDSKTGGSEWTTLDDYYTVYYPGQPGGHHPQYEGTTKDKHTYANYIMNDPELKNKKDRADKVKTELKNCMPNLNTYIYNYLIDTSGVKFNDSEESKNIQASITNWIEVTRDDSKIEKERNWNNNWQKYYFSLKAKNYLRQDVPPTGSDDHYNSEVISQYCLNAITNDFTIPVDPDNPIKPVDAISHMFGAGGVFHE